jgi:hypothetical protein
MSTDTLGANASPASPKPDEEMMTAEQWGSVRLRAVDAYRGRMEAAGQQRMDGRWALCSAFRSHGVGCTAPNKSRPDDYRRQKDDARGPMGPTDGAALAGQHATPDRAPAGLARQNSEAVTGRVYDDERAAFGPPFLFDSGNGMTRGVIFKKFRIAIGMDHVLTSIAWGPSRRPTNFPLRSYKLPLTTVAIFAPSSSWQKTSPWRITATTLPVSRSTI